MDRRRVERWITGYEKAWRAPGTELLSELFAPDVVYLPAPWGEPVVGLEALEPFWETRRTGPDEAFTIETDVLAVEMETAVVRADVEYLDPTRRWRNLWVVVFSAAGRCVRFEEWPFAPDEEDGC